MSKKSKKAEKQPNDTDNLPGNPRYPAKEDIYSQGKKEEFEEDGTVKKTEPEKQEEITGEDLDIPGSELDDPDEAIGEEDEENNYYSLGGDNHDDLEEDKGE